MLTFRLCHEKLRALIIAAMPRATLILCCAALTPRLRRVAALRYGYCYIEEYYVTLCRLQMRFSLSMILMRWRDAAADVDVMLPPITLRRLHTGGSNGNRQ